MVRAVVVGHGEFAHAIISTVEGIVGKQDNVDVVSNRGVSCEQLCKKIAALVSGRTRKNTIIFLDLPGGSCTISCYQLLKDMPDLNIISGVNLPMLIEFFMLRDKHTAHELIPILINKGKDNIIQIRCRT